MKKKKGRVSSLTAVLRWNGRYQVRMKRFFQCYGPARAVAWARLAIEEMWRSGQVLECDGNRATGFPDRFV